MLVTITQEMSYVSNNNISIITYHILIGMFHGPVYKPPVSWQIISIVLTVIDDACTIVLGTDCAACTYYWNKGATALSNIHPLVTVIDDVGIVLSCNFFRMTCSYIISGIVVVISCYNSG